MLEGPCSPAAPPGQGTLIDDFEDGDQRPFRQFKREGWWFSSADSTPGEITPKPGAFEAEPLPEQESTPDNRMAAHFTASGYSDWGVSWGTTLSWVEDGIKCPFNASAFDGVRFKAKGQGRVRVHLGIPETVPKDQQGGRCKEKCWDTHSRVVMLTDNWETYEIPWEQLQQWGWGTEAKFDPSQVLSLQFAVDSKNLPVDFWIDDVEFTQSEGEASSASATGSGAASSTSAAPSSTAASPTSAAPSTTAAPSSTTTGAPSSTSAAPSSTPAPPTSAAPQATPSP